MVVVVATTVVTGVAVVAGDAEVVGAESEEPEHPTRIASATTANDLFTALEHMAMSAHPTAGACGGDGSATMRE